jgi:hypothetical protein
MVRLKILIGSAKTRPAIGYIHIYNTTQGGIVYIIRRLFFNRFVK